MTQLELIGKGALAKRGNMIEVSSPLIHAVLLKNVVPMKKYILTSIPVSDGLLDVYALVRVIVVIVQ
jgi:hypothetical protein